jgi:predicted DNA-binding antitoxin AbrB/MazE fold protein
VTADLEHQTMTQIEAIYQGGVFRPLVDVYLEENQRVRLNIEAIGERDLRQWLDGVRQLHQRIVAERGHFPDSALDIAEDRRRNE